MISNKEDILRRQLSLPYHQNSPFGEQRADYLFHLLTAGWSLSSLLSKSRDLSAFAHRVDIAASTKIDVEVVTAAAQHCLARRSGCKSPSRSASSYKARSRFAYNVTEWLRFLGRLSEEPHKPPLPHSSLVKEFSEFLAKERGLAEPTIKMRLKYVVWFLAWFDERQPDLSKVSLADVERFLASPRARR